jgi:hypothetical protein
VEDNNMSFDEEFKRVIASIRQDNKDAYERQTRNLKSFADIADTKSSKYLIMILARFISESKYLNEAVLQINERIVVIIDRIASLQNRLDGIENQIQQLNLRGKETEELQEQQNAKRIEQQRNIEVFNEIGKGIKTIVENRAKELEKQEQDDETSAGGNKADQEPRRDSKTG